MPELPEVETIVNRLRGPDDLPGRHVTAARLLWAKSLASTGSEGSPSAADLDRRLPGQTLERITRRGKFIQLGFSADTLLIHLRMSGDLRVEAADAPLLPHDRFWMEFTAGTGAEGPAAVRLAFNDPRKFGRLWLLRDPDEVLGGLGPEPLDPDFTSSDLYQRLQGSARQLKPLLLDQTFLVGLGNIYTDESLNLARLHPLMLSNQVTPEQAAALWSAIREILAEGIRRNGASIDWVYRGGDFQNHFRAYQRTGEPCPACGTPIQRIRVGQRGTHFCPVCQRLPD